MEGEDDRWMRVQQIRNSYEVQLATETIESILREGGEGGRKTGNLMTKHEQATKNSVNQAARPARENTNPHSLVVGQRVVASEIKTP